MGMAWKIEKLRNQLKAHADLFAPNLTDDVQEDEDDDVGLGEEELEILRDAGVIAVPSKTRKRRSSRTPAKHIVFVENEEEGMYGNLREFTGSTIRLVPRSTTICNETNRPPQVPPGEHRHDRCD
jgi:hypothetical protein